MKDTMNAMSMTNYSIGDDMSINSGYGSGSKGNYSTTTNDRLSCWRYWTDWYYPQVIRESYPVYIRERAQDKAKQAYEIVKILKDKKLAKLEKVVDFIDLMDELIKIL